MEGEENLEMTSMVIRAVVLAFLTPTILSYGSRPLEVTVKFLVIAATLISAVQMSKAAIIKKLTSNEDVTSNLGEMETH